MSDFAMGPVLGTGSFGRVSLARYNKTGVMCAIKALSKSHVVKNQQVSRIQSEPRLSLRKPAILAVVQVLQPFILHRHMHSQVQHLKAEREVLKVLDHPFVVHMLGSFQDLVCVYFVIEYVCGGEFFRHLKARGR